MKEVGIWEPLAVKAQTFKTAIETSCMLLRIDDVVSGIQKDRGSGGGGPGGPGPDGPDPNTVLPFLLNQLTLKVRRC